MSFTPPPLCDQIHMALAALRTDPYRLGGAVFRIRSGPVRQGLEALIAQAFPTHTRIHPQTEAQTLLGGLDAIETLTRGQLVRSQGAFEKGDTILLTMAERTPKWLQTALAQALDQQKIKGLIVFDEGAEEGETIDPSLKDRLAFAFDLNDIRYQEFSAKQVFRIAQAQPSQLKWEETDVSAIVALALRFGIESLRPAIFTFRLANYFASLRGGTALTADDIEQAAFYTLLPRIQSLPEDLQEPEDAPPETQPQDAQDPLEAPDENTEITPEMLGDVLIDALKSQMTPQMLSALAQAGKSPNASGQGSGMQKISFERGRPKPTRKGRLSQGRRVDILATLTAAAPWQKLRRDMRTNDPRKVIIFPSDLHIKRYAAPAERLVIFAVDASGSAAMSRLGEAKGAVELLLGEAYSRRDFVALIAFRGEEAQLLLPPTRALVAAKRQLGALPGGGGTPLASGLKMAYEMGQKAAQSGKTPLIAVLTDGRANIALNGTASRQTALEDAQKVAQLAHRSQINAVVLDMGRRANKNLSDLANIMGAQYFPLPFANAHLVSNQVAHAMDRL